jgi:cytochrome c-type biogenesis protein CcmH/NrfG
LTNLGRALAGLGHLADAADAYQQAASLRRSFLDNVAVHREIVSEFTNAG